MRGTVSRVLLRWNRPGAKGGNGPLGGKFTKLSGKVSFWVLSSKINVIQAEKGLSALF